MAFGVHSIPLPLRYLLKRFGPQFLVILGVIFLYWGLAKKGILSVREWFQSKVIIVRICGSLRLLVFRPATLVCSPMTAALQMLDKLSTMGGAATATGMAVVSIWRP